ncbi:hypothetical protein COCNU_scaffold000190G000100 [Cocos nucifera]|nr:hypothetical protein [Cocos nucifera]
MNPSNASGPNVIVVFSIFVVVTFTETSMGEVRRVVSTTSSILKSANIIVTSTNEFTRSVLDSSTATNESSMQRISFSPWSTMLEGGATGRMTSGSPVVTKGGYLEVGVQTYGGGLWHTWFDRDLTLAGRVMIKEVKDGSVSYSHKLVRIEEPIMRIPTLAIHLDRSVPEGFKVNTHSHLVPVLATSIKGEIQKLAGENGPVESNEKRNIDKKKHHPVLLQLIANQACCEPDEICDFELQVCDTQPSLVGGAMKEFIFSGRLDNLCMSFCSLKVRVLWVCEFLYTGEGFLYL